MPPWALLQNLPLVGSLWKEPLFHKAPFWFEPRTLELFGLFLGWASLPPIPFSLMPWLLVKELVVLLEPGFVTLPHIREVLHFRDGLGQ